MRRRRRASRRRRRSRPSPRSVARGARTEVLVPSDSGHAAVEDRRLDRPPVGPERELSAPRREEPRRRRRPSSPDGIGGRRLGEGERDRDGHARHLPRDQRRLEVASRARAARPPRRRGGCRAAPARPRGRGGSGTPAASRCSSSAVALRADGARERPALPPGRGSPRPLPCAARRSPSPAGSRTASAPRRRRSSVFRTTRAAGREASASPQVDLVRGEGDPPPPLVLRRRRRTSSRNRTTPAPVSTEPSRAVATSRPRSAVTGPSETRSLRVGSYRNETQRIPTPSPSILTPSKTRNAFVAGTNSARGASRTAARPVAASRVRNVTSFRRKTRSAPSANAIASAAFSR